MREKLLTLLEQADLVKIDNHICKWVIDNEKHEDDPDAPIWIEFYRTDVPRLEQSVNVTTEVKLDDTGTIYIGFRIQLFHLRPITPKVLTMRAVGVPNV